MGCNSPVHEPELPKNRGSTEWENWPASDIPAGGEGSCFQSLEKEIPFTNSFLYSSLNPFPAFIQKDLR